jgi:hypothetical protein
LSPGTACRCTTAKTLSTFIGPPSSTGFVTFCDGPCSGNSLPSVIGVGRLMMKPTWRPLPIGRTKSTVLR